MKVIKRNGSIYELNVNKLKTSILNSASDINILLTQSDIKLIVNQVFHILNTIDKNNKSRITSTYELRGIIQYVLVKHGFKNVASSYMNIDFRK